MTSQLLLPPFTYVHVEDLRTCEVLTVVGPYSIALGGDFRLAHAAPQPCVVVPPGFCARVRSPVAVTPTLGPGHCPRWPPGALPTPRGCRTAYEYRPPQPPFPLFPGEVVEALEPLLPIAPGAGLLVRRGDVVLLLRGPGYYCPRAADGVVGEAQTVHAPSRQCVWLRAERDLPGALARLVCASAGEDPCGGGQVGTSAALRVAAEEEMPTDPREPARTAGEEWSQEVAAGTHLAAPHVSVLRVDKPWTLGPGEGLHVRARRAHTDAVAGVERAALEEWLVTADELRGGRAYLPPDAQEVLRRVLPTVLRERQYCSVVNPVDASCGAQRWGERERRVGPCSFLLRPGEALENGTVLQDAVVLSAEEALLVRAAAPCTDECGAPRAVGERWLVAGPCAYVPPLAVSVLERRRLIPLHPNQGVYVRDTRSGRARSAFGAPLMLGAYEELCAKAVSRYMRALLSAHRLSLRREETPELMGPAGGGGEAEDALGRLPLAGDDDSSAPNDSAVPPDGAVVAAAARGVREQPADVSPYAVVTAKVEHNTLVRLYDRASGGSRVAEGPVQVCLGMHEEFTPLRLSGGRPKRRDAIHALCLYLGPDYMADVIEVETRDHARLRLSLAYNWEFDLRDRARTRAVAFAVPDFIGEACHALASRIRAVAAGHALESFQRHAAPLIRRAVFGAPGGGDVLCFPVNGLLITSVDVQEVRPVERATRQALLQRAQLAVDIAARERESHATHAALLQEQEASGALELQALRERVAAEAARAELLTAIAHNAGVEQVGASRARAEAEGAARVTEARAELHTAPQRRDARSAAVDAEVAAMRAHAETEKKCLAADAELRATRAEQMAEIAAAKCEALVAAVGRDALSHLARAAPERRAHLLSALGL